MTDAQPADLGQLSRDDLDDMSPEAIEEARLAGRFDDVLAGRDRKPKTHDLNDKD